MSPELDFKLQKLVDLLIKAINIVMEYKYGRIS